MLTFSTDTLTFDTVFTTLGSTTRYFKVFNTSSSAVTIEDLRLMHLVGTQFRINVDGVNGDQFSNIEIPAKDSIYVFVEVTVNPNSTTTPFLIIDDVSFMMNSKQSIVHLQAFGQNAHFHYGEEIASGNTATWNNDLPHVIISKDTVPGVYVRCGATLNINPGCKIFFAGNSAMFIEGTLNANATTWSDSIVFQGARLESFYEDRPGQWFGIVFLRPELGECAPQGSFNHCIITESSYGIYAGAGLVSGIAPYLGTATRPDVSIKNTIVKNTQYNAVQGFNAKIEAENSIFYISGDNLVKLWLGGDYKFTNCTLFNNGSKNVSHEKETLVLNNAVEDGSGTIYSEGLTSIFKGCVVYGSLQNELQFSKDNSASFQADFSYNLMKTKVDSFALFNTLNDNNLFNQDPRFRDAAEGNFIPWDSVGYFSPLIDYTPSFGIVNDIYDRSRPVVKTTNSNFFDVGAVEVQ